MLPDYYEPEAVIETDRLILRPPEESDAAPVFYRIKHDREVLRYYVDRYLERVEEADLSGMIASCRERGIYCFIMELKSDHTVIGMLNQCSVPNEYFPAMELGYALGKDYWNRGYCTEAMKAVTEFLFTKGVHKITCCHITENTASGRVMQKSGMKYEGIRKSELYYHGKYWDMANYYLLNPADEV